MTDGHLKALRLLGGEEVAEEEEEAVVEEEEVDDGFVVGDERCARREQAVMAGKDSKEEEVGMSCGRSAGPIGDEGFGCSRLCMGGKG